MSYEQQITYCGKVIEVEKKKGAAKSSRGKGIPLTEAAGPFPLSLRDLVTRGDWLLLMHQTVMELMPLNLYGHAVDHGINIDIAKPLKALGHLRIRLKKACCLILFPVKHLHAFCQIHEAAAFRKTGKTIF